MEDKTPAEIAAETYAAALDSVALISRSKPEHSTDEEWADTIERNKEHLRIVLARDIWEGTDHDLSVLEAASQ